MPANLTEEKYNHIVNKISWAVMMPGSDSCLLIADAYAIDLIHYLEYNRSIKNYVKADEIKKIMAKLGYPVSCLNNVTYTYAKSVKNFRLEAISQ